MNECCCNMELKPYLLEAAGFIREFMFYGEFRNYIVSLCYLVYKMVTHSCVIV